MARPASKDPLDKFRWAVEIDGFTRAGFAQVDVPSYSITSKSYAEGGNHLFPKQIVDSISYKPVSLVRGVTADMSFDGWARQALELPKGKIVNTASGTINAAADYRRTVTLHHLNRKGEIVKSYILYKAFPIEYEPASTFASDGDDVLSMEKLVLTYESFEVKSKQQDSNPFDLRDVAKRLIRRF